MSVSSTHSLRLKHSIHDAHQENFLYWISNQEFNQFLKHKQNTAHQYHSISDRQRSKAASSWSCSDGECDAINDGLSSSSCSATVTFKIIDGKKSRGGAKSGRISLYVHNGTANSSVSVSPCDIIDLRWKTITQRTFSTKSHVAGYHCGRTAAVELSDGSLLVISHENAKDKIGLHDGNAAVDDRHPPFLFSSGDASGAYLTIRLLSSSPYSTLYLMDLITHVDSLNLSLHSANGNVIIQCNTMATVKDERHLSKRQRMRLLAKSNHSSSSNEGESNKKKPNKYAKVEEEERSTDYSEEIERKHRIMESSINEMKRSIQSQASTAELINEVDELESFGSDDDESDDESSALDFDSGSDASMSVASLISDSFSVRGVKRRQCSEASFFDEKRFDLNECDDKMFIPIDDPPISMPGINSFIDNLPPPFNALELPMPLFPVGSPLPFPSLSHDDIPLLPPIDYDRSLPFSFPHSPSIPTMQLMRNFSLSDANRSLID